MKNLLKEAMIRLIENDDRKLEKQVKWQKEEHAAAAKDHRECSKICVSDAKEHEKNGNKKKQTN